MTIKKCDNCNRIINRGDRSKLVMFFNGARELLLCKKCKTQVFSLLNDSKAFSDGFKATILSEDEFVIQMRKLKNLEKQMKSKQI